MMGLREEVRVLLFLSYTGSWLVSAGAEHTQGCSHAAVAQHAPET